MRTKAVSERSAVVGDASVAVAKARQRVQLAPRAVKPAQGLAKRGPSRSRGQSRAKVGASATAIVRVVGIASVTATMVGITAATVGIATSTTRCSR